MRLWQRIIVPAIFTAPPLAAVLLSGCATPYVNQHIEAVNAEYRALETYSYELERENSQLCDEVEMLKDENTRLRGGSVPARRNGPFSAPNSSRPKTPSTPRSSPSHALDPDAPMPGGSRSHAVDPDAPMIHVPESSSPAPAPAPIPAPSLPPIPPVPRATPRSSSSTAPRSPVSMQKPAESSLPLLPSAPKPITDDPPPTPINLPGELPPPVNESVQPEPIDGRVTNLYLNPLLTHGANLDSNPGDDGLALVLEPRNQSGQFVPQAGAISIVVLDPAKSGDAARIARWNLDEKLVRQRIDRSNSSRGIHLQLPWAGGAPETSEVKLFVRYQTADGRQLEAQHNVILNPSSQASQRWTPRPGDRPRPQVPTAIVNTPPTTPNVTTANPPLPAPGVQSDLTKVTPPAVSTPAFTPLPQQPIQEPAATQTDVAIKQPAPAPEKSGIASPPLLQPPPPSKKPEWQPFR
ncbi:hypothetical protein [Anatilimnocola floriformis]|uniref:hypothetical protein n=1 Tax=Anatilimnocola floriformis TaxID=2948575 RepID=UPI0020C56A80|nr:hypothetical protein [Anatilimnocola floriformis]